MQAVVAADYPGVEQKQTDPLTIHWNPVYNVIPWLPWAALAALAMRPYNRNRAAWLLLLAPIAWVLAQHIDALDMLLFRTLHVQIIAVRNNIGEYWLIVSTVFLTPIFWAERPLWRRIAGVLPIFAAGVVGAFISWTGLMFASWHVLGNVGNLALYSAVTLAVMALAMWRFRVTRNRLRFLLWFFVPMALVMPLATFAVHSYYLLHFTNTWGSFWGYLGASTLFMLLASAPFPLFALLNREYRQRLARMGE